MTEGGQAGLDAWSERDTLAEAQHVAGSRTAVEPAETTTDRNAASGTLEIAVMQVDYTLEGREETPIVHVFGRTPDGTLEHVRVRDVRPYFYVPADVDCERLERHEAIIGWETHDEADKHFESIRGEPVLRVYAQTPRDVGQIRESFTHYEADVLFPNRFLIDAGVTEGMAVPERRREDGTLEVTVDEVEPATVSAPPRVSTFDIEVEDRNGFPEDGEEPIICVASHDSYRDEYVLWLFEAPDGTATIPDQLTDYEPIGESVDVTVRAYETEPAMLEAFVDYIVETDPDILTGWNFDDFDAPYLLDRLERLEGRTDHDLDGGRLSRVGEVWRSNWGGPDIKGRVVFDLLYAYRRTVFSELDSYRLDAVGEEELGVGKERYAGDIGDLWERDATRLCEYNLRDVELCVELDRQQEIIPFWREVATFVGCKLEDATTPGDAVDMYVLHEAHGQFVLPSKGQQEGGEEFEGGAVFEPVTGVLENVSVLDLKSLYPMCMVTINASPETKLEGASHREDAYVAPTGTRFAKDTDGIIREMVTELLEEREEKKALRNDHDPGSGAYEQYDRQQGAVKVIMNCFTPDTEVLTPDGVQGIHELEVGDPVYSLDPESMELEVKPVRETHSYPEYDGELVEIQSDAVDFRVTPNHRMLVRDTATAPVNDDEYRFVEAQDLTAGRTYELPQDWKGPAGEEWDTIDLTEVLETEYEVWISQTAVEGPLDGDLDGTQSPAGDVRGYVLTAQEFADNRAQIEDCEPNFLRADPGSPWVPSKYPADAFLDRLARYIGTGNESKSASTLPDDSLAITDGGPNWFTSSSLHDVLRGLCADSEDTIRIPSFVFDLCRRQKRRFLDGLVSQDSKLGDSWQITIPSRTLRDDVLRLCAHLGRTTQYDEYNGSWTISGRSASSVTSFTMERDGSRESAKRGVYCVTVADNHTLLAGRNGTFQFVGQSLYGVSGWERFRLYDEEAAAAITATGREVIRFSESAANELGHEVAYGDSVTGDRPVVTRDPDGRLRVLPIAQLFEAATRADQRSKQVASDGGSKAEQTGKARRPLPGWEALSISDDVEPVWRPIEQVIRHETDKSTLKLQHKFGESTTTRDHSYVVEHDGKLVETPPEEVEEPLRVPGIPPIDQLETIDIYEELEGYTRTYEDGRGVGAENTITKTKRIHADEEWVWFGQEHHGDLDSTVKVKRHIDLSGADGEALVRLVSAYLAEGSASTVETASGKFGASIAEERGEWLEQLQSDYGRLFTNATAGIIQSDTAASRTVTYETDDGRGETSYNDRTQKLQMMNELTAIFFQELAGQTSRGKRVPWFVYHLTDSLQNLFIETLVEGDGSRLFPRYSEDFCERNFDYETVSRELAGGVSILLTQRGVKHSFKFRESKGSYTIRTCDYYGRGREPVCRQVDHDGYVYDLSVEETENFVDAVGGIVLHNTDSVMLELGADVSTDDAIKQSFAIEDHINSRYDDFALEELNADEHRVQIEFENLYRRFFQAGKKKRYAGHLVWKEGKDVDDVDITGFEYQRSDIAPITKEVQHRVLEMIVKEGDLEAVKAYVSGVIEEVLAGEVSLEDLAIPGGIGKRLDEYETDTAHVRGAKYANAVLGTNFQRGSKPKRLYLERVDPAFFRQLEAETDLDARRDPVYGAFKRDPDVICFEYADQVPEAFAVDYEKMLEKTLQGPIERVLEAIDVSWEEARSGQEQTGLDSWA